MSWRVRVSPSRPANSKSRVHTPLSRSRLISASPVACRPSASVPVVRRRCPDSVRSASIGRGSRDRRCARDPRSRPRRGLADVHPRARNARAAGAGARRAGRAEKRLARAPPACQQSGGDLRFARTRLPPTCLVVEVTPNPAAQGASSVGRTLPGPRGPPPGIPHALRTRPSRELHEMPGSARAAPRGRGASAVLAMHASREVGFDACPPRRRPGSRRAHPALAGCRPAILIPIRP